MGELLSPYILAGGAAWLLAQTLKYGIQIAKRRRMSSFRALYLSGGMPSAHSATVVAVAVSIGWYEGVTSPVFALAVLVASIVMYDAVMVRRSSGEQGESLTALIKEQKSGVRLPRVAKGHSPLEVIAGALLGCIVAAGVVLLGIL